MRARFSDTWLPVCLVLGISEDRFWNMNPRKVKPYKKAYELCQKARDDEMWRQGGYVYEATLTALENILNGHKAKLKYRDQSYTKEWESQHLSDEQKKQGTIALFKQLEGMQKKFEKTHPKKNNSMGE